MNLIPNPWIIVAFLIALAGAYLKGHNDGSESAEGQQAKEDRIALIARTAAQTGAAKEIAGIQVKNVTIRQTLEKEVHEKTIYAECRHTPDGLRIVNSALTGRTEPADRGKLPRLDATQ